ncbi:MAG: NAD(P)H-dependent oxidoreductase [Pseudomonadales bacterium]
MNRILSINASVRVNRSLSRDLSRRFEQGWLARFPQDSVINRDVGAEPPPVISEAWIDAAFTDSESRSDAQHAELAVSEELICEVEAADVVVIATPMYNYGMPAGLKAWVDQIVRINRTFDFDLARGDYPLQPLLRDKVLVMLTSTGEFGFEREGPRATMNHLTPHLRTVAKYLGATTDFHLGIEYQEFGDGRHADSKAAAHGRIPQLIEEVAGVLSRSSQKS